MKTPVASDRLPSQARAGRSLPVFGSFFDLVDDEATEVAGAGAGAGAEAAGAGAGAGAEAAGAGAGAGAAAFGADETFALATCDSVTTLGGAWVMIVALSLSPGRRSESSTFFPSL